jgi:hypothetical protein
VGDREREDGEALGDIFLHPGGKFGSGLGVGGDEMLEPENRFLDSRKG